MLVRIPKPLWHHNLNLYKKIQVKKFHSKNSLSLGDFACPQGQVFLFGNKAHLPVKRLTSVL
jgi:hypothetical protein